MKNNTYVDEVCHECASSVGASMPSGHLATYYEGICDACGHWKVITGARDFGFPRIKKIKLTQENRDKIVQELRQVLVKYQCQGNSGAVDEIKGQITFFIDENH